MGRIFEKLSFKQKIIFGFSLLSAILIFGMGYMLFEFTNISQLSTNIIEKQQPIIRTSSNARENSKSAANHLHKFILNGSRLDLYKYTRTVKELKKNIKILLNNQDLPDKEVNIQNLQRANFIVDEIDQHVKNIKIYKDKYEENHPVINAAASVLNPLALEYLGLLNSLIDQNTTTDLPKTILISLSNMRHTWTQMLSSLRITLATRQAREFVNVRAYADVNYEQLKKLKKMNLDLGVEGIEDLEKIRNEYIKQLETVITQFNTKVWRMDANVMTTKVMPLFDELERHFDLLSKIQLNQAEKADSLFSEYLIIARYRYITLIVISLIVAFIISSFITYSLRKPLKNLVNASNEVAKGNFDTEISIVGNDEISYLGKSFNEMMTKLKQSQSALITARDNAEHANHAKSQFLTRMSHELRTPLNAILGFAQLLELSSTKNTAADESHNEYVKNILKSGWHLLELVEELLDLSRIETNTVIIKKENVNIKSILQDSIEIIRPAANEVNMTLVEEITDDCDCFINVDPLRFKQIMLNLLTNAVKFNSKEGKVTIECEIVDEQLLKISVCDQGKGITKEQESKVFDMFQRLDADEKAIGGAGVGLSIAKNLVELMDGNIGLNSKKGQGTCFWIVFPMTEVIYKLKNNNGEKQKDKKIHKILYIEDDIFNLELVKDILSVMRPEVILLEAMTAENGLEIAASEKPDLILMDINLPGMSGNEALIILKNNKNTIDIPVIAISADALEESILLSKEQGFKDYITKPINVDDFVNIVDTILENVS